MGEKKRKRSYLGQQLFHHRSKLGTKFWHAYQSCDFPLPWKINWFFHAQYFFFFLFLVAGSITVSSEEQVAKIFTGIKLFGGCCAPQVFDFFHLGIWKIIDKNGNNILDKARKQVKLKRKHPQIYFLVNKIHEKKTNLYFSRSRCPFYCKGESRRWMFACKDTIATPWQLPNFWNNTLKLRYLSFPFPLLLFSYYLIPLFPSIPFLLFFLLRFGGMRGGRMETGEEYCSNNRGITLVCTSPMPFS
jgi:hypothetical protein